MAGNSRLAGLRLFALNPGVKKDEMLDVVREFVFLCVDLKPYMHSNADDVSVEEGRRVARYEDIKWGLLPLPCCCRLDVYIHGFGLRFRGGGGGGGQRAGGGG
jgi:hypothetical protein